LNPVLLDTHTMLWAMFEPKKLSAGAHGLLADPSNALFVSICSLWEITIKVGIGKMTIPGSDVESVIQNLDAFRIRVLAVRPDHLRELQRLPLYHRDPFDRMLIAQSRSEKMPLISKDTDIRKYALTTIW